MDPNNQRPASPSIPERHVTPSIPDRTERTQASHQDAAANLVRNQVAAAYDGHDPVGDQSPTTSDQETTSPYQRTHSTHEQATSAQWAHYHSAWQKYYQQYYERYYIGEVYKTQTELNAKHQTTSAQNSDTETASSDDDMSRKEAINDLRSRLKTNLNTRAKRFRASRHFVPVAAAVVVMLVFGFLQYNRTIFAAVNAYTSPGNVDPSNIIPPSADGSIKVSPDPLLIIPKLNINVPVDYSAKPDQASQMKAMLNGTAYFGVPGANARPGQVGNFSIAGHSSNDVLDGGKYKFIFVNLPKMRENDVFYLNYQGTRYTYTVSTMREVQPTDVAALTKPTNKPQVTLITCVPIGTADRRLLVTGTQVSPDPSTAKPAPTSTGQGESAAMPGNSPTFVERVFGGN